MAGLPPRIRALLWQHTTLVLATSREDEPAIAAVFYAPDERDDGVTLTCALLSRSHKLANLRVNPRVAVYLGPREPTRWIQAMGTATIIDDPATVATAIARLTAHAPGARVFVERVPVTPVVITLESVRLTDLTGERPPFETWPPDTTG